MSKTEGFVRLIDLAISAIDAASVQAVAAHRSGAVIAAAGARTQFESLRQEALDGKLLPSNGAGLGMSRALDEWAPDDVFTAGLAVENFYRQHF